MARCFQYLGADAHEAVKKNEEIDHRAREGERVEMVGY